MKILKIGLMAVVTLVLTLFTIKMVMSIFPKKYKIDMSLRAMTTTELQTFDGSDKEKPIYLAYEGNIYDVTEGREYYQKGGVYHYLAGKDSTYELNFAGGGIVKSKYKVVARLVE